MGICLQYKSRFFTHGYIFQFCVLALYSLVCQECTPWSYLDNSNQSSEQLFTLMEVRLATQPYLFQIIYGKEVT